MLKKVLQILVSFSLLVGGYAGYTRLFAVVTNLLDAGRMANLTRFAESDSETNKKANAIARESFGGGHWASTNDRKLTYYDDVRGLYLYAQNYERLDDGRKIHVWPFAMVWLAKNGENRKPITSDEAIITLSQPFGLVSKPGTEPSHIVHAKLIGNVRLRDDKGTRDDPSDDLRVGPLTDIEFDEKTLQITSDSDVLLQDRDLTLTGIGLMIQLRRKVGVTDPGVAQSAGGSGSGYDAETAYVYKDVHITINNVTSNGVLPGTAKPEKSGKTPLDLRCDGTMRIDLPLPRPPVLVGPPDLKQPPDPTFAKFKTNVVVIRGSDKTDQLNCDTLDLTLMPDPKPEESWESPAKPEGEANLAIVDANATPTPGVEGSDPAKPKPASGPLTELKIRSALARGDAVWLQSEVQGMVARCVELKYEKHSVEGMPDVTYLNGGTSKKLWVEKVEYDTKAATPGTIKSIFRLISLDATIFDYGPDSKGKSKIIARGPGRSEERPARNASITRTAWWEDEMEMLTWRDGESTMPESSMDAARALKSQLAVPLPGTLRRLITLTGVPKLIDHQSATTLDSKRSIVTEFQAKPKVSPTAGDGPMEIKWLDANEDAHLTAPSRTLTARQFLKAKFETPPPPPVLPPTPAGAGPVVASATPTPPAPTEEKKPDDKATPVEPAIDGRANRVWAHILLGANNAKGELKDAQLRGSVMVHQDPSPGKALGSNASGEALDLISQGNGLMKFAVKSQEPTTTSEGRTVLASGSNGGILPPYKPARVEFEGKTIESDDIIGLDQREDFAWSHGSGTFTQMADKGLLDDKGVPSDNVRTAARPKVGPTPKDKLAITWIEDMRFYGKSRDLEGRPAAKIEFRGMSRNVRSPNGKTEFRRGVEAKMTESVVLCESMDVYMDRTINLTKQTKKSDEAPEPEAQIAMLDCRGANVIENGKLKIPGVVIVNEKTYPDTGEFKEKQRIEGIHVSYDKRTGAFEAPGPGTTWLYQMENGGTKSDGPIPTSSPSNAGGQPRVKYANKKPPKMKLTKVLYNEGMRGRFGVARDQVDNETREALFVGSTEAANAVVSSKNSDIDFDHPVSTDYVFLSSDRLHVFSVPPPIGSKASARSLLNARGNGVANTIDSQIQADLITYDSASELMYAYGQDGKEVSLSKQDAPGQAVSNSKGKMLRYNKATRASDFKDPQSITFADMKTGIRAKPFSPDVGGSPKKPDPIKQQRMPLQRTPRQSTERKSFTGGT